MLISKSRIYQLRLPRRCKSIMYVFKSEIFSDSFLDSLPFLSNSWCLKLNPGEKNLIYVNTFPFLVQSSKVRWPCGKGQGPRVFNSAVWYSDSPTWFFLSPSSPEMSPWVAEYLNIIIHQLRRSHWEAAVHPGTSLCTQEGLKFCDFLKSVEWSFLSNSLWYKLTILSNSNKTHSNYSYMLMYSLFKDIWRCLSSCLFQVWSVYVYLLLVSGTQNFMSIQL